MINASEKIPNPKEIEKEISEFLTKKFGPNVKVVSPVVLPQESLELKGKAVKETRPEPDFDLKPEELIAFLDQYVIRQDAAKAVLATKICTHFNRIQHAHRAPDTAGEIVGGIKNNILMIGPTGVGKTYIIKLIAKKIGVPFVKGDATKFSETGYVGGDVEDLVRDLVREADDDIDLAEHGIIYIDEIDKIASSRNLIGADVSRTGVQRALLKPLEETEVDLRVPHDPVSMMQEIEHFRKTGSREKRSVNTRNILFIMSGAFGELAEIVDRRLRNNAIGFGAPMRTADERVDILKRVRSEDLIQFGFESEFVGRLPVRTVFEPLGEEDLHAILKNPNNPIVLGKKLDFAAYGIRVKFEAAALRELARRAQRENTGARGLVSAVENALIPFETRLPSTEIRTLAVTASGLDTPAETIRDLESGDRENHAAVFQRLAQAERDAIQRYLADNRRFMENRYGLTLTPARTQLAARYYGRCEMDIGGVIKRIKGYYDDVKKLELTFFQNHDINIVLEEDAIDHIIETMVTRGEGAQAVSSRLSHDFELGLKLVREKTGKNRFFINRNALQEPESFIAGLIRSQMNTT